MHLIGEGIRRAVKLLEPLMGAAVVIMDAHYWLSALASEGLPASAVLTQGTTGVNRLGSVPNEQCLFAVSPHESQDW